MKIEKYNFNVSILPAERMGLLPAVVIPWGGLNSINSTRLASLFYFPAFTYENKFSKFGREIKKPFLEGSNLLVLRREWDSNP